MVVGFTVVVVAGLTVVVVGRTVVLVVEDDVVDGLVVVVDSVVVVVVSGTPVVVVDSGTVVDVVDVVLVVLVDVVLVLVLVVDVLVVVVGGTGGCSAVYTGRPVTDGEKSGFITQKSLVLVLHHSHVVQPTPFAVIQSMAACVSLAKFRLVPNSVTMTARLAIAGATQLS